MSISIGASKERSVARVAPLILRHHLREPLRKPIVGGTKNVRVDRVAALEPDLVLANDTQPDLLFLNEGTSGDGVPTFTEEGKVRGLAFDERGRARAGMGIDTGW